MGHQENQKENQTRSRTVSDDVECPYCGEWQEMEHDEGYGCKEGEPYKEECEHCGKMFVYYTSISFHYEANKADCLNGAEHNYQMSCTLPKEYTHMQCVDCGELRGLTQEEWGELKSTEEQHDESDKM